MAAPANDLCANATVIASLPYSAAAIDISQATESADDPNPGFIGSTGGVPGDTPFLKTTWYVWTCPASQTVQIATTDRMGIYVGVGTCGAFTEVASYQPQLTFAAVAGTTYTFMFGQLGGSGTSFDLTISASADYPNQLMITAATITLPFSVTVNDSLATDNAPAELWYKYVPVASDIEISIFPFQSLAVLPAVAVFAGVVFYAPDPWPLNGGGAYAFGVPYQVPCAVGQAIYVRLRPISGTTTTLDIESFVPSATAVGDILVPDDSDGFSAAVLGSTTGLPKTFIYPFRAGEGGDVLPVSGIVIAGGIDSTVSTYSADLGTVLGSYVSPFVSAQLISIRTNQDDAFYVGWPGALVHAQVHVLDIHALLVATIGPFATTGLKGAAPNRAETILYYHGQTGAGNAVQRWDIVNNVALTDLAPTIATYFANRPLLVLADDTILMTYARVAPSVDTFVRRYDATGTVLNTYNFGTTNRQDFQLASALDDPTSFWVWLKLLDGISRFSNLRTADGAVLTTFDVVQFEEGVYQATPTATPVRYGHSESCPFLLLRAIITPPSPVVGPVGCPTGLGLSPTAARPGCASGLAEA